MGERDGVGFHNETDGLLGEEIDIVEEVQVEEACRRNRSFTIDMSREEDTAYALQQQYLLMESTEKLAEAWFEMKPIRMQYRKFITGLAAVIFLFTMALFIMQYCFFFPYGDVYGWGCFALGAILFMWTFASVGYACRICSKLRINNVSLFIPMYFEAFVFAILFMTFGCLTALMGPEYGLPVLYCINTLLLLEGILVNVHLGVFWVFTCLLVMVGFVTTSAAVRLANPTVYFPWVYAVLPFAIAALCLALSFIMLLRPRTSYVPTMTFAEKPPAKKRISVSQQDECNGGQTAEDDEAAELLSGKDRSQCILSIIASTCCAKSSRVFLAGMIGSVMLCFAIIDYGVLRDLLSTLVMPASAMQGAIFHSFNVRLCRILQLVLALSSSAAAILLAFPFGHLAGTVFEALGFHFMNLANRNRVVCLKEPSHDIADGFVNYNSALIHKLVKAQAKRPWFGTNTPKGN